MGYLKYKDEAPEITIKKIKSIFLERLGIDFQIKIHERINGVYSANIIDSIGKWSTCGKGTNVEYCLASGLGEAIEHFCNYNAFDYSLIIDKNKSILNFERYYDEKKYDIIDIKYKNPDLFEDMKYSYVDSKTTKIKDESIIKCWEDYFNSKQTLFVPYFDVKNNKIKFLPEQILDVLCGSNGSGAGNTNEEAIGHALDELVERYVKYKIYNDKLTPPNIDLEYIKLISNDLYDLIENIKKDCNCDVYVKDASLGKGFTALCVLIIDRSTHSYLVNFGAHPKFEVALERCITEMFQSYEKGYEIQRKKMQTWNPFIVNKSHCINNWTSLLRDDVGIVSNEFFYDTPSWEFKSWQDFKEYNNKLGVNYQMNNLLANGYDIYIRNNSFLGFPVFTVYVPKISLNHIPFNDRQLRLLNLAKRIQKFIIEKKELNDDMIHDARNLFSDNTLFGQLLLRRMCNDDLLLLQASILFDDKNVLETIEILNYINSENSEILRMYLKLLDNMSSRKAITFMMNFYQEKELQFLEKWESGKAFKNLFIEMIKKENYSIDLETQKYLNDLYLAYKGIQLENSISQDRIF